MKTEITTDQLSSMIDHTFLKPNGTSSDIETLCTEAMKYNFGAVMVHPAEVERSLSLLKDTPVKVGTVIGFPLGQNTTKTKSFEIHDCIEVGVAEVDMVINIRAMLAGDLKYITDEIHQLVNLCKPSDVISKVILETCYLNEQQITDVCLIARSEGVDFVKTSTGFGSAGASVKHVQLMRKTVGQTIGVKASGGIRDLATALEMISAGANRLGTSSSVQIIESLITDNK